jgi:hypothetical protein
VTDSGVGLTVGARGVVAENILWSGSLKYRDLDEFDSAPGISVSGHYYFRPNMAAGVVLTRTDYRKGGPNETSALLNFRYDFSSFRQASCIQRRSVETTGRRCAGIAGPFRLGALSATECHNAPPHEVATVSGREIS